jgi:hypothetical protein
MTVTPINKAAPSPEQLSKLKPSTPEELQKRRRRIDNKLSEVYDDATSRYLDDWTDKRVAEALNVPQALVVEVREFSYGSIASNPSIDVEVAKAKEILAEARKLLIRVEEIEKRLIDIQKAVRI